MDRNNRINEVLFQLADAAAEAADGMTDAVQNASHRVSDKYEEMKIKLEINRLYGEQERLFADIGRTMYLLQAGDLGEGDEAAAGEAAEVQMTIDRLLLLADQKQQDIDAAAAKLKKVSGEVVCPGCAQIADGRAAYCPGCGAKIK